jgi:Cys-rich four helix bundle protein (predicted Tat secretion target)
MTQATDTTKRSLMKGIVAGSALLAAAPSFAEMDHSHHNMGKLNKALIKIANECAQHGDECIDHCIELFKTGDTSLANCADTVNEMIVMCRALAKMATYQSEDLKAVARVSINVCQRCVDECSKHEDKHPNCKACADSCRECIKECKKIG